MNDKRNRAMAKARQQIKNLERGIETMRGLPDLRDIARTFVSEVDGAVFIVTAYNLNTYRHNRRALHQDGWSIEHAFTVGDGDGRHSHLKKDSQKIVYSMDSVLDGSTCARVQVGEVVSPVYQVSCAKE
jgi:hypothetical protein